MAEHPPSDPVEMGAAMDYPAHEKSYSLFLTATKYSTLAVAALLIAMAFSFFTSAGMISGFLLWLLIIAVGAYAMR